MLCVYLHPRRRYLEVEPKRRLLQGAQAKLEEANRKLASVRDQVITLEERKIVLQDQLVRATEEKNRLLEAAQRTAKRLNLAERLVNGLKDENERWGSQVEILKERKALLVGDTMVAASFIAYIGPFNEAFRNELVFERWIPDMLGRDIPMTISEDGEALDPVAILAEPSQVAAWKAEGLPSDRLSVENGAIISACVRWPLLIDPQQQGVKWIKRHEEEAGISVTQFSHRNYLERVRRAMEDGTAVLIENVPETLDAVLEPVLARATMRKGRKTVIRLGEREVDVLTAPAGGIGGGPGGPGADMPLFRLYLQTKLPNPHYSPEVAAQATLINFSVTVTGLQEQLLSVVVNRERAELEQARLQLVTQQDAFTIKLKELEDDLLFRLANAEGDVLADEALIESLEATKMTVRDVELKAAEARLAAAEINRARETFRPVAARASMLYFIMDALSVVNPMYQYSLSAFNTIFCKALDQAGKVQASSTPAPLAASEAAAQGGDSSDSKESERTSGVPADVQALAMSTDARESESGRKQSRIEELLESTTYSTFACVASPPPAHPARVRFCLRLLLPSLTPCPCLPRIHLLSIATTHFPQLRNSRPL